ncbi:MAG: DUF2125 domain-containing protein [Methylovirgula sp.]
MAIAGKRNWLTWTLLGLVVFCALAWTVLWNLAAGQSEKTVEAWIAREKSFGRIWFCPERSIRGFPFAIEMICTKPRFDGIIFGRHFTGGLGGFRATAVVFHPTAVTAWLGAPFAVSAEDENTHLELAWDNLRIALDGLPQQIWHVRIHAEKLAWRGTSQEFGPLAGNAERLSGEAANHATGHAYDFDVKINAARLPDVDRLLSADLPADIAARGTVTQAGFDPQLTLPQNMDNWRAAGGRVDLAELNLTHGPTRFTAHGSLGLDDLHRVEGKLNTESYGLAPLLIRLGVNPMLVSAGTLLSGLLNGTSSSSEPDALVLPIGFEDGFLSVGPAQTSIRLPALY